MAPSPIDHEISDFHQLFLRDTPLLDVRAPVEFEQGAFPRARNIPLINDEEREQIGIRYKELGQDKAIELGHELVQGEIREQRVEQWVAFTRQHPQGVLYCFRGGMRSKISQQWIYEKTGIVYPRVRGGYKALRRFLIDELEQSAGLIKPVLLGGRTGVGKTLFLKGITQCIDLEGLFHHRGSVFGKHVTPQPSQIDIENALSIALLKHRHHDRLRLLFEDEAAAIGSRRIPVILFEAMKQAPLVLLEASLEDRIEIIFDEYIVTALAEYQNSYGEQQGFDAWTEHLLGSLDKIQRRLGGLRHQQLKALMHDSIEHHRNRQDNNGHRAWIKSMLTDYYDPMYDYQIGRKRERIVFRGDAPAVKDFLRERYRMN